jgi:hypothetical protein
MDLEFPYRLFCNFGGSKLIKYLREHCGYKEFESAAVVSNSPGKVLSASVLVKYFVRVV